MIRSTQKVIKIGSSGGVTIPAKEMERHNIKIGQKIEIFYRPIDEANSDDNEVINSAKQILSDYKSDFKNLANR